MKLYSHQQAMNVALWYSPLRARLSLVTATRTRVVPGPPSFMVQAASLRDSVPIMLSPVTHSVKPTEHLGNKYVHGGPLPGNSWKLSKDVTAFHFSRGFHLQASNMWLIYTEVPCTSYVFEPPASPLYQTPTPRPPAPRQILNAHTTNPYPHTQTTAPIRQGFWYLPWAIYNIYVVYLWNL